MAVRIRLARLGRTHLPYYRVVAIDGRNHREGRANEVLGIYDPVKADKNLEVNIERIHHWVNAGAELSHSVEALLKFSGLAPYPAGYAERKTAQAAKRKAKWAARTKKPGTFVPASKRALKKHQAKLKAVRVSELKAAHAARAAEKAAAAPAETTSEA